MIMVNINTLTATRASIPQNLQGLSKNDLNNLQTALTPVPSEFKDIEFWDEVDQTLFYDVTTHVLDGTESFTCNADAKTVAVIRGIRAKTQEELYADIEIKIAEWKASRSIAVANIKVIVNDMEFDGDEVSQTRMTRAIVSMNDTDTIPWVLADNTPTLVTKAQLMQALKLAGEEQTRSWVYRG